MRLFYITVTLLLLVLLYGCAEQEFTPLPESPGHISAKVPATQKNIPQLVQQVPVLPKPEAPVKQAKYTVVVNEVPVKEVLFLR